MNKKVRIATLIYAAFAVVLIGVHLIELQSLIANLLIALVGLVALAFCIVNKKIKGSASYSIVFGVLFSLLMAISMLYNGNANIYDLIWIWSFFGIALLSYSFEIPTRAYYVVHLSVVAVIIIYILIGGVAKNFFKDISENNISAYLIFFVCMGYLSQMRRKTKLNFLPSLSTLAISLWSGSRAGVLATVMLVLFTFFYNLTVIKKRRLEYFLKAIFILLILIAVTMLFLGDFVSAFLDKISRYGSESTRTEIWSEYFCAMFESCGNFLFGVDTLNPSYPLLNHYSGNTHNAFLMLHSLFGMTAVVAVFALIVCVIYKAVKNGNPIMLIVLCTCVARMMFDWIGFTGLYDVLFWYMALYVFDDRKTATVGVLK